MPVPPHKVNTVPPSGFIAIEKLVAAGLSDLWAQMGNLIDALGRKPTGRVPIAIVIELIDKPVSL